MEMRAAVFVLRVPCSSTKSPVSLQISPMSDAQPATNRPTKKQRKALAHKERARLKKEHALDLDANGLPATDNDQRHEDVAGQQDPDSVTLPTAPKSILKKRKRDDDTEIPAGDVSEVKKPKQLPSGDEGENQDGQEQPEPQKKRYILFVGTHITQIYIHNLLF